ncbi:MAG: tetratricopeptide repeat protein [Planctomycetes bacterium]|nr:tetratricopeptide repeat protein [Planctomycetota bacterium]
MRRILMGLFAIVSLFAATQAQAGEDALKKKLAELNNLTGADATQAALKSLIDDKKLAHALADFALPDAKKKSLSYNGALVLALIAAEKKDMKTSEVYFRVCMDQAAKVQSFNKLKQAYGLPIDLYYESKQYTDATRICKELLELNTEDGKERVVIPTIATPFGGVGFGEKSDGFHLTERLRGQVFEIYVKATAKQGKYDQALKLVDGLLKRNDNDWIDLHLKGWVYKEAGKMAEAAAVYEDVMKQVAKDTRRFDRERREAFIEQFRYEVSNFYIELKQIDRAIGHLETLVKQYSDNAVYANDLGYILADNEMKLDEAEKLIRKAIDLDRERRKKSKKFDPKTDHDPGAYLDSLGWVLFKQKKNQEAKDWLIKALTDKSAQHIEIYDHLGDVYIALGEREAAIRTYEQGLKAVTESRRDQALKAAVEKKLEKLKGTK